MSARASGYIKTLRVCPNGELIDGNEKYIALILADSHQDRAGHRTFPSVEAMADDARKSVRHVQLMLAQLEAKGVIRREYPRGQGRGRTTFYFFPELDDVEVVSSAQSQSKRQLKPIAKGCQDVTLSDVENTRMQGALFDAKGCQKGERRVKKTAPPYRSNKYNKSNKANPPTPASGGDGGVKGSAVAVAGKPERDRRVELAVDQVMQACGFQQRRLRGIVRAVLEAREDVGEPAPTTALAMIAAWQEHLASIPLLWKPYTPQEFFGLGYWRKPETWRWNEAKLQGQRNARVGMQDYCT